MEIGTIKYIPKRVRPLFLVFSVFCCLLCLPSSAQEETTEPEVEVAPPDVILSQEFVQKAWEASSRRDLKKLDELVEECLKLYGAEADESQALLKSFPARGEEDAYQALNDVGTVLFIQAEAWMNSGKTQDAIAKFQHIIDTYKWSQAWDPRGWYWSVAEKSQASIDVLTGKVSRDEHEPRRTLRTVPRLNQPGTANIVDYTKYGKFQNVGNKKYRYAIADVEGLAAAVGEGIYPNISAVYDDPRYKIVKEEGRLEGSHWDFVNTDDLEAAFYKWATAPEPWGVRLFYTGMVFEKARMYHEALRAYHALIVHYPKTIAWTYWQTPWYPSQAAVAKIRHILRMHPGLGLEDKWMKIQVKNSFDNDADNDEFVVYPGKIVAKGVVDKFREAFGWEDRPPLGDIVRVVGEGKVKLVQFQNGHWQMRVNGEPYVIKAITYSPTKIGQSPDKGTLENWMTEDTNNNGLIDGPYEAWVDQNRNNTQDADEPTVGDFHLLKEMGVNTLRIYHDNVTVPNKELLREMFNKYGIRVIMGDFVGKYAIGSGASWAEGTDYENPRHRLNMMESVKKMVMEHKDEPYLLLWVLGNENNYGVACNADKKPGAYFQFVDEVARFIKSIDPDHPVAVNNGDTLFLDIFAVNAPNVDIFSANVYRGDYGFGSFWEQVEGATGKPAFISEYGAPSFAPHLTLEEAEEAQMEYHKGNWMDIKENLAGTPRGAGNALGGVVFEWLDEWWKNYEPYFHDRKSDAVGPFPGGYYFEEWFGIVGQGDGKHSPFMRQLRKTYYMYKEVWNN